MDLAKATPTYGAATNKIECKVEVFSINALDQVNHTYSAGVYVQLRVPKGQKTKEQMEKINCEFINLKEVNRENRSSCDGDEYVQQHIVVVGEWTSPLLLKNFPMDRQVLEVKFEIWDTDDMSGPCVPTPFGASYAKGFMLEEAFILKQQVEEVVEEVHGIPTFSMKMTIHRRTGFYIYNYMAPITLMTSLCFCVLGIECDADGTGDRLSTVLTLLLTVVAYKMALSSNLPVISTPCKLDMYMTGAFFIMFFITIAVSMEPILHEGVDFIISCMFIPWVLFNFVCVYEIWRFVSFRSIDAKHEDYQPLN